MQQRKVTGMTNLIATNNNMLYTPTTTEVEKMNRTDLVFELAKKCHIDHYQTVLGFPTEALRKLLTFYNKQDPAFYLFGIPVFITHEKPVFKKLKIQ